MRLDIRAVISREWLGNALVRREKQTPRAFDDGWNLLSFEDAFAPKLEDSMSRIKCSRKRCFSNGAMDWETACDYSTLI